MKMKSLRLLSTMWALLLLVACGGGGEVCVYALLVVLWC